MIAKITAATCVASLCLVACDAPVAQNEMVDILPMAAETAPADIASTQRRPSPDAATARVVQIDALDFRGTYAMSGVACDRLAGTMTIAETSFRLSETVCGIVQSREVAATSVNYTLSDCANEGGAAPDRNITVAQDEFGNIQVTKWSDQTFEYKLCPQTDG